MRPRFGILCLIAGCASGGGDSPPPPQFLPPALRGYSGPAMAATYWVFSTPADYTVLRDIDQSGGSTWISSAPDGGSFLVNVGETLDSGIPVSAALQLTLPPQGSASSANLIYPAANASLSYMAFGEWMIPMSDSVKGGFFAFGSLTPGPAIPTSGAATYNGAFHGKAFEGSLLGVFVKSIDGSLSAAANFATRTVSISTTNPTDSSYNLSGALGYPPGTNQLSGFLGTASGYSGGAVGRFFGPNAEELGGAFRLTRPNFVCIFSCVWLQDSYVGSFGARR